MCTNSPPRFPVFFFARAMASSAIIEVSGLCTAAEVIEISQLHTHRSISSANIPDTKPALRKEFSVCFSGQKGCRDNIRLDCAVLCVCVLFLKHVLAFFCRLRVVVETTTKC